MRPSLALLCIIMTTISMAAQPYQATEPAQKPAPRVRTEESSSSHPSPAQALPVRQVILYKNGIGYFEHTGEVTGNQHVAIDFTSSQLNDVLQSLTILDENGGRIGGVNYNSTTPLAEQLKSLSLAMDDDPTSQELFKRPPRPAHRGHRCTRRRRPLLDCGPPHVH